MKPNMLKGTLMGSCMQKTPPFLKAPGCSSGSAEEVWVLVCCFYKADCNIKISRSIRGHVS